MFRRSLMAGAITAALAAPSVSFAADASPHSFTANVGLYSQYIFRGMTQTNEDPAVQGGFDYAFNFGRTSFYVGNWNSNVSWLRDGGQYSSSSLESDFYGGFKGNIGNSDFTWDVGVLYYWYPGSVNGAAMGARGDTTEIYGAAGWKWFGVKYSYVVSDKAFTVLDAQGTSYWDFSATYPVANTGLTLLAHYGIQKFEGTDIRTASAGSNDTLYSYDDWKIGATYDLGKLTDVLKGTTLGGYYTDTSGANALGWGSPPYPKEVSGDHFTFFIQKTF